ncbi:MAG TPA: LuxR C-terminal-related transcriptional regulator [Solirubrobacteraceae bacterium]|jgi:DNA-binding NarL/FixJ family response regulator
MSIGVGDPPLIGRGRELAALTGARSDTRVAAAAVFGTAGVGKSRLAREVLARAEEAGALAEWTQATRSAAAVPFGGLAEIVPDASRSDDLLSLMHRCAERLVERAGGRQVVLGVDDAHLLDSASAALVLHLVRTRTAFVITTVRSGERCPDAIVSLWKDEPATRLELAELDDDDVHLLVEGLVAGPVEHGATQWVIEASGGNPLYVREFVRGAIDSGAFQPLAGLWTMVHRPRAGSSLIELVDARMADLDQAERDVLEYLALAEPLGLSEIGSLVSEETVLSAERKGLLVAAADGLRLAHSLYGEAVRASLPELRARAKRLRLVDVLEARRTFGPDEALRVARLRLDAGAALPGELTLEAARAANRAGDPELGAQLAELALAADGGLGAALVLAQSQRQAGWPEDAEATLADAEGLAPGDPNAGEYARQRLGLMFWELRRPADALALLGRLTTWSEDESWQAFVLRISQTYEGVIDGQGLDAAEPLMSGEVVSAVPRRLGEVLRRLGLVCAGEGDAAAESAFQDLPRSAPYDEADLANLAALVFVALEAGHRWHDLEAELGRTMHEATRLHLRDASGIAAHGIARLHVMRGRYHDAARWLAEAEFQLRRNDPYNTTLIVRATAVAIACFSGDFDGAVAAHERLQSRVRRHPPVPAQRPMVARAAGWAEWVRNPTDAGQRLLADAESFAATMPGLAAGLAYDALRTGNASAVGLLEELGRRCHTRLVSAYGRHATARADRAGGALLDVAEEMAEIGALRYAVEAASEAASVFLSQGRHDSARRAAARARELHVPDQGAPLPLIDGLDATAVELTPRQAQLIEFARQGLSNAEIADRLVISVRTVETHLYRGMQKLGISDRHDL